jgi:hypothetical protein
MPLWDDLPEMLMTILLAFVGPLFPAGQVKIVRLPGGGVKVAARRVSRGSNNFPHTLYRINVC